MRNFLSGIIDTLTKTNYQNIQDFNHINIKDDAVIVNLLSKIILPILLIFGFYVHSHGDYTPGGGFQAGIIFACALCLYYFINPKKNKISYYLLTILSMLGFVLYTGIGIISFFKTGKFLDFTFLPFSHTNARGVFIVELGIAFVVFSSVARVFTTLLEALQQIEKTEKTNKIKSSKNTNSVNTQKTYTQHTVPANSSIAIAKVINNKV